MSILRFVTVFTCVGTLACANEALPSSDVAAVAAPLTAADGVEVKIFQAPGAAPAQFAALQRKPQPREITIDLLYPQEGQSGDGLCWMGLLRDWQGRLYPIGSGEISQLSPSGEILAGEDDQNYFLSAGGGGYWGALDARQKNVYVGAELYVRSAPFVSGSSFSDLAGDLQSVSGVTMGRGSLSGSVLFAERNANTIKRIELSSHTLSILAQSAELQLPEAIVSAPGGTVYVVSTSTEGPRLLKVTTSGIVSTFVASAAGKGMRNGLAVDAFGRVYWSSADGIEVYARNGDLITTLPPPPDQTGFGNAMGMQIDRFARHLYVVDNYGCKRIYKYTLPLCLHATDEEPAQDE